MNKLAINALENEINNQVRYIDEYLINWPQDGNSEFIGEFKNNVLEYRRAIAILKVFSMNDLIDDLLKNKKEN